MQKLLPLLLLAVLSACSSLPKTQFEGTPNSEAEADYRAAVAKLESGSNQDAVTAFNRLKLKYPYAVRWSTLADLRIADALRYSGDYAQAAANYQDFVRTYPAHGDIAYASYQAANCYYELMPSDLFFLPDPWQRDRKSTKQAEVAFRSFLRRFPNDVNAPKAQQQYEEVRSRLAKHELYVAEYYFKRKAYEGACHRLEGLIKDYPDQAIQAQAQLLLAHCQIQRKDPLAAKKTLENLVKKHPESSYATEAKAWLKRHSSL